MRGTEGEAVANVKRAHAIDWFYCGECRTLVERQEPIDELPRLPDGRDPASTARWIEKVLKGEEPAPRAIREQARQCVRVSKLLREKPESA